MVLENKILKERIITNINQDRLRNTSYITVKSVLRNKVSLNVSWYDVHSQEQNQKYSTSAGSGIEF